MPLNEYDALTGTNGLRVPDGNEYDQLVQGGQNKEQLDAAKLVASKRDPKRWARILDISKRTKLPTDVVDRNFDSVSAEDERQKAGAEYDRLIADTPGLSNWLKNPDNATIGRDEIASLARVERGTRLVAQKDESGFDYAPTIGYHDLTAAAGTFAAVFGIGDPDRVAQSVAESNARARALRAVQPDYVKEFQSAMEAHGHDVNRATAAWLASQEESGRSEISRALESFKTGAITLGDVLSMVGAAARRPRGLAYSIAEGFPSSVPLLTGSVIGAGIGAAPGLVGGALIGGMLPSVGAEINGELEKHGIDVTNAESLSRAYRDPALMAGLRAKAARKGVTVSMVNALVAPLGGKLLESAEKAGAGAVGKAAATAADVGVQAGGITAGDVAGQKAAGEEVNVGQAIQSGIATLGYAFGQEAIGVARRGGFHADPSKAAAQATAQANEALRATRDAQALAEIGTAVSEAKTTQTVPESMKSLVDMVTGSDPDAQVYFQTKDWDEHFQAAGSSPAKAVEDITGDSKPYYDAKATGAPIAIPLSDYVARVAPTEHWGKLLPFARTKPDGMSLHEASDYLASLPKTMEEIANESGTGTEASANSPADARGESARRVGEDVRAQLTQAGVSSSVAKAQASLYEAGFRTLAERSGLDPYELYSRYALKIRSETAPAPKAAPESPPLSAEEVAARTDLTARAESAVERDALTRPDPYTVADNERDPSLKTDEGQFVYARTDGGTLRSNLSKVSVEGLIDEYGRLFKAQNEDQSKVVPTVNSDEDMHSNSLGRPYTGLKGDAVNAKGRIAQRAKSLAKVEAELKARGVENLGELLKESFELFQFAAPGPDGKPSEDAMARYAEIVRQIRAYPEERRQLLLQALKAKPDMLELYQSAFHGSPHIFNEFSLHKIGSGEGHQAYGWGLYFSGKKEIAAWYREKLAPTYSAKLDGGKPQDVASILNNSAVSHDEAYVLNALLNDNEIRQGHVKEALEKRAKWYETLAQFPDHKAFAETMRAASLKLASRIEDAPSGRLYKVDIPEDQTMLDWDKPLSEQSAQVQSVLRTLDNPLIRKWKKTGAYEQHVRGQEFYQEIVTDAAIAFEERLNAGDEVGSPPDFRAQASRWLSERGVTGIKYLDGSSRGQRGGSYNYVIFDDKLVKILEYEQKNRGRIQIGADRSISIELLKGADRSTFLHETAHFYLEVLRDLSKEGEAVAGLAADYKTIRDWLGAEGDGPITRAQHETFARSFESYLMEGKAPSAALRDAFYRFKRWLVSIYKAVSSLGVELTPEVRKVFDRMLAVDSEIAAAEEAAKAQPLFVDPKAIGMSDQQAESYQRAVDDAHQAAEEALTVRMMKQIRREESAEWKAWRDPIEAEVTSEVNKRPEYRALAYLRDGTNPDGSPLSPDTPVFKLSRDAVRETYGDEAAKALPKGVTARDGLHPDLISDIFGYASGKEFLDAISQAPKKETLIRQQTDARMQLEHGERLSDFQVRDMAAAAVQNEKRALVLRKQAEFLASEHYATFAGLAKKVTRLVPPSEEVKAQADRIISSKPVRELRPAIYEAALRRLAKEAQDAFFAGDVQKAFDLNVKQLLTNEVMRAAANAKEMVENSLDGFKKFFRPDAKLAKSRDMDLVNAGRAVLATFGIGRSEKPVTAYLEQIKRYDPEMYATVSDLVNGAIAEAPRGGDYRSLSFKDFQALNETLGSMWSLSRRTKQVEIDGVKLDRHAVQEEMAARIAEIPTKPADKAGYARAVTKWEKTQRNLMSARSWLRRVEHWVDAMDGGAADGPFRRYIWNPVSEGATAYRVAKRSAIEAYLDVVKPIEKGMKSGTIEAKELGYTFENKAELLGALLHTGNESNLSKLLRGRSWGNVDETGTLDRSRWNAFVDRMQKAGVLAKADYDYVQGVWDIFEGIKPDAQRAHKEMYGHYFAEVTASSFETPFGNYRGGYYPAKADPFLVPDAQIHREAELLTAGADNSFMFPTTGRGFTKTRVEAYAKPLIMNAAYVPMHLDAVLRFTHIEPRVKDVGRMVVSPSFRSVLDGFDPTVAGEMLVPWLQRAAMQRVDLPGKFPAIDRFWKEVRNRTGLQIMTANVLNALQQYTGASISLAKVEPGRMGSALWQYVRDPRGTAAAVAEKSDFMRTRMTAGIAEIQKTIDDIMLDPSKYDKLREFAKAHGYFLAAGTQHTVDAITWMGKYDEAIARGVSDREAVREADSAVRETQGSFAPEDISRVEAQTPFVRAFMQFYGYFNMQANVLGTEFLNTVRNMGLRKGAGRLVFLYVTAMAIPAVLSDAIMRAGSGKPFDDDDDGPADDVFGLLFGSQVRTATRFIPIVGPAVDAAIGAFTKSTGDDDIRTSPAVTTVERSVHAPADVYHAIKEREIRSKDVLDVLTAIGMLTGLPTAPLARPINYIRDVRSGKTQPRNALDFARGLATGR